ncbi:MAG: hypothetical protein JNM95_07860 [Chitinophagaceae bacterium]|nr:hypothetical protein [Chitinophagaceae bacterium]
MKQTITILAILIATLQSQAQRSIKFGVSAYYVPIGMQKEGTSPFLFLNSAQSAGLELSFAPIKKSSTRIKLAADYIMGSNNKESITTYAKENKIEYTNYKFSTTKPSGFSIMSSPQFMLFPKSKNKKLPLMWLDLKVGALFSNNQSIQFLNIKDEKLAEVKSNAVNFVYNPTLVFNVIKTKKLFFNLKVGYSNWGGVGIGVGIAESDCRAIHCNRCPAPGCCNPCGSSSFNDSEN